MMDKSSEHTMQFSIESDKSDFIKASMLQISSALKEKGYNPINQIVGYIMSGDPTYVTSYNDARKLIKSIERDELLEELISSYIKQIEEKE